MSFSYQYNYPQIAKEAGFKLRQYKDGPLDWRLIGSVEIERMLREQNLEQIDTVLNHLCEVPLGSILESNILDSGIAKYFTLSQFAVQYLLFCRQFMEESASDLREAHGSAQIEIAQLKNSLKEADNEIKQLRKKITHIEAVHEIIYPCHLCSKNFISNDALNLHISRKHTKYNNHIQTMGESNKSERNMNSKEADREMDVHLINTIKLELEIKHLKERLNKAEREIKDKYNQDNNDCIAATSKDSNEVQCNQNVNDKPNETTKNIIRTQSIGIQSNLMDVKDIDDYTNEVNDQIITQKQSEMVLMLEKKLNEFNDWKEKQNHESVEFLQRIYQKLQYLIEGYEKTTTEMLNNKATQPPTSVDHIEELFNIKFDDISKKNEMKWMEMLNRLEMNFKEKINNLKEIPHKKEEEISNKKFNMKLSNKSVSNSELSSQNQSNSNSRTFETKQGNNDNSISNDPERVPNIEVLNKTFKVTYSSDVAHLKSEQAPSKDKPNYSKMEANNIQESSDDTDISGNSQEESANDSDSNIDNDSDEDDVTNSDTSCNQEEEQPQTSKKIQAQQHQQMTKDKLKLQAKENVNKVLNARLSNLGISESTRAISNTALARLNNDLQEKRYRLKKKHSKFHTTRRKIKAFVDKICSTKLPVQDEVMSKEIKPKYIEQLNLTTSTPLTEPHSAEQDDMKERLEHILASPIMKPPSTYFTSKHQIKAMVHHSDHDSIKPIPMPRKRVMFHEYKQSNQATTYQQTDGSSSGT